MRKKRVSNRPWFVRQCSMCNDVKHLLEFRRRSLLGSNTAVCKICEGEPVNGMPIRARSN